MSAEKRGSEDDLRRAATDDETFELLVERYYAQVASLLRRWVRSEDDRLDLTQDIFLKVYKGWKGFRGEAQVKTWVFTIAYHTSMAYLRKGATDPLRLAAFPRPPGAHEDREQPRDRLEPAIAAPGDQFGRLRARERDAALRAAIERLPDRMRHCVELRLEQDLKYQEIATVLRVTVETVKAHLLHARSRLREILGEGFWEEHLGGEE